MLTDIWAIMIWRGYCYWRILFWMVLFAVIGQILGYLLISMINDDMLKAMIGAIAIEIGCRYFIRLNSQTRNDEKRKMRKNIPARASIWCSLSGFSSFISLTGGIPVQIFLLPLRMHRYLVVGTSAWFFFSINIAKIPFSTAGYVHTSNVIYHPVTHSGHSGGRYDWQMAQPEHHR